MQDLLPDYVAESLKPPVLAAVETHLLSCAACVEDVALLRTVRALRPAGRPIDVARILVALPAPVGTPDRVLSITQARSVRRQINGASAPPARVRTASVWQVAAAIGVIAFGGASLLLTREQASVKTVASVVDRIGGRDSAPSPVDTSESLTVAVSTVVVKEGGTSATGGTSTATVRTVAVSYGDLGDYTDDELQRVLDRLERWDGTSSAEPLPSLSPVTALPATAPGGSSP